MLVVAGSFLAWRIAGSWGALLDSGYGAFLLVKVLAVLVAIASPHGTGSPCCPASAGRRARRDRRVPGRAAGPDGAAEAGVLVAVLLVTGFLVDRSPETSAAAAVEGAATESAQEPVVLGDISAQVALDPPAVGPATLTITMTDARGGARRGLRRRHGSA